MDSKKPLQCPLLIILGFLLICLFSLAKFDITHSRFIALFDSYVSETHRRHAIPSQAQRHILAGIATVVGGLSAPYAKASHVHERPIVNWLWAAGCHPFGPFSNTSHVSQMLLDVALVSILSPNINFIYKELFLKLAFCLLTEELDICTCGFCTS
jgi:hypothetical protein